jgi:hypothetical protein
VFVNQHTAMVAGSKRSTEVSRLEPLTYRSSPAYDNPPATRTRPYSSRVAVCAQLASSIPSTLRHGPAPGFAEAPSGELCAIGARQGAATSATATRLVAVQLRADPAGKSCPLVPHAAVGPIEPAATQRRVGNQPPMTLTRCGQDW